MKTQTPSPALRAAQAIHSQKRDSHADGGTNDMPGWEEISAGHIERVTALPKLIAALRTVPQEPDDLDSPDPFEAWAAYRAALQLWQQSADRALADAGVE